MYRCIDVYGRTTSPQAGCCGKPSSQRTVASSAATGSASNSIAAIQVSRCRSGERNAPTLWWGRSDCWPTAWTGRLRQLVVPGTLALDDTVSATDVTPSEKVTVTTEPSQSSRSA